MIMLMVRSIRDGWSAVVRRPMSNVALVLILGGALALTATSAAITALLMNTQAPRDTHEAFYRFGVDDGYITAGDELLGYRDDLGETAELVAYRWNDFNLAESGGDSMATRVPGLLVDGRLFAALGWRMQQGRGFLAEDFAPGAAPAVVIGDALWRSRFGGDADVVGRWLRVDGQETIIIGVLPPQRAFPFQQQIYQSISLRSDARQSERNWWAVTWLADANQKEQFTARMAVWQAARESRLGRQTEQMPLRLDSFWFMPPDPGTQMVAQVLKILIVLLLLLAAVNAGGLLLVQWLARARELATRQALGASPWVAVSNLVAQVLWLGVISAAVGVMLAWLMVAGLNQYLWSAENGIPLYQALRLSPQVLGMTGVATILALSVLVLPTARRLWRGELATDLRVGLRSVTGLSRFGRGLFGLQCLLAVSTVAVALVAGEGARRVLNTDLGVDARNVLVAEFQSSGMGTQQGFARGLRERLSQRSDVEAVSVGGNIPAVLNSNRVLRNGDTRISADYAPVDAAYRAVYRLNLRQGRWFSDEEVDGDAKLAVLDPSLAQALFDTEDVIGRSFEIEESQGSETYQVIGLSETVRLGMRGGPDQPSLFVPFAPHMRFGQALAVRMRDGAPAHIPEILKLAREVDPDMALDRLGPHADWLWSAASWSRFVLMLFAPLGGFALALAATGLAALLGALVAQQVREIGVRRALGASAVDISRSVAGRLLLWGGAGIGLGLVGALLVSAPLSQMLYGESDLGWVASIGALMTMGVVLLAAAAAPLRRALCVPPMEALRSD